MSRSRSASLAVIFAVVFIDLLGFGIVLPLLAPYGRHFDADGRVLGLLVASFSAMQFLFAPAWGRLSDRIGRRPVLLVGLAGSTASYALFGLATSLPKDGTLLGLSPLAWLFVSRIGAGISGATISTAQAYISDVTQASDRAKGMALIGAAFGIGFTFGPLLGIAFASEDPHAPPSAGPGYLAAALSAIAFVFAALMLKEPERHASAARPLGRWELLRDPLRLVLLGEIFLAVSAFAMFESTLSLLGKEYGNSDRQNYYLFAFVGLTLSLTQGFLVRRLAPRLRERRMAPLGLALLAAGLCGLTAVDLAGGGVGVGLFVALSGCVVGFAFLNPAFQSLLSLSTPGGQQGAVLGLGQSASALARIAGPIVGVSLFERSIALTYGTAAVVIAASLAAIVPVLAIVRRSERTSDQETLQQAESEPIASAR